MLIKIREKPLRLKVMESLANRMTLAREDRNKFNNWVKGYNGELRFDVLMKLLKCECLILHDLYLEVRGKSCQIDTLVITAKGIFIYEVKNFEGQYYYQDGKMYHSQYEKEVFDPIYQIRNAESIMRQLVNQLGYNIAIQKYIVFVNPNFTLFGAPRNSGLILPSMIDSHIKSINEISSRLNQTHHQFAEEIKVLHKVDISLRNVPYYEDSLLKKGVTCVQCGKFINQFTKKKRCVCSHCGEEEVISQTIIRLAKECQQLFPERKITVSLIFKWCDGWISISRIRYVLNKHLRAKGTGRWRYYEF